jgi:hypothetical protein
MGWADALAAMQRWGRARPCSWAGRPLRGHAPAVYPLRGLWVTEQATYLLRGLWVTEQATYLLRGLWVTEQATYLLRGLWMARQA